MNSFMSKLLKISETYHYIHPVLSNSVVSHFKYGPLGDILCQNIFNEWMLSNVISRDGNVFPFYSNDNKTNLIEGVAEHYLMAKKICGDQLPFSIVQSRVPVKQKVDPEGAVESKYFRPENVLQLRCVTFTAPDEGRFYFHYWLRQRKFWWRRFSANPARFSVTNINTETENLEFANIEASFPWGVESIEEVKSFSNSIFDSLTEEDQKLWKLKPGKKNVFPCIIESVTNLEIASMCFLCDAFVEDVRLDAEVPHQVIKLHRKLAPYKIGIVADTQRAQKNEDLIYLAEFLSLNLKKLGISTLFLLKGVSKPVEEWFQYYDLLSVPYVVVLQESTLSDGLFGLRSRETTLQERLHIDQLTGYVEKLLK